MKKTPLIIIVAIVALAGIGYFLYSQGKLSFLPSLPGVTRVTEADFEFIEDATLRKHMVAQANKTAYRTKTYSDGADLYFTTEVQIKGEEFNTRDIESTPDGKETKHKIVIGNTTYVKDYSDNKWWKETVTPEELPEEETSDEPIDYKEEYSQPDLKFKALGKEACGNLTCFKYEQLNGGQEGMAFKRIFWFDDREYLLRKDQVTVGEFTNSIDYSYDNINIIAPSPTKDVPAGKSIYDYYYGTETPAYTPQQQYTAPQDIPFELPEIPSSEDIGY